MPGSSGLRCLAAATALRRVNSAIVIEAVVADFHSGNAEEISGLAGTEGRGRRGWPERAFRPQVILDGTDNAQTRDLMNDLAVRHGVPWVYGGCVGVEGG